jgi:hypothetical protein
MEQSPSSNTNGQSDEQQNPPPIMQLPNFNFNFSSCTTFTHFQNEPEATKETKALERH